MNAHALHNRKLGAVVTVRPLRDGDTQTVAALFDRLGPESRARRFHGPKPRLTESDLRRLAQVGPDHHALVAYVGADAAPAGIARLVRDLHDPRAAEIAFEVADCYQGAGLGTQLVQLLLADARAAGFERVVASVESSNRAAFALLRRVLGRPSARIDGGDVLVAAPLVAAG
ncbi:MAG TPA: GNAT family N-acetyltransferase [Gaiellaceae bacterium]|nr:GNAT family N-acetyltransferase [Gaiellaceae bacterium]